MRRPSRIASRAVRSTAVAASALSIWLAPSLASAQDCPEGDWFCEPAPEGPEAPGPGEDRDDPARSTEPDGQSPAEARWRGRVLPEPPPPPRQRRRAPRQRFGFDIHVLGALMAGEDAHRDAGMGGIGFGLRYRPIPHFAVDGSLELAFGTDYNGFERTETALLANAVAFFNPRDPVQVYMLAGLGLSSAEVSRGRGSNLPYGDDEHYSYFGMQLGGGLEARLTRRAALRVDLVGFVRGRTDDDLRSHPEFVDPDDNRVTNTSGGVFGRAGGIFYW